MRLSETHRQPAMDDDGVRWRLTHPNRLRLLAAGDARLRTRLWPIAAVRRRKKVEMRFAHMKRIFRLDRLRLRGLSGAKDEVLLTATAQNLRRLVKLLGRPPPPFAAACLA